MVTRHKDKGKKEGKMKCKYCEVEHPDNERANPWYCIASLDARIEEKDAEIAALKERVRERELLEADFPSREIADELNMMVGDSIRKNILPGIKRLKERINYMELRTSNDELVLKAENTRLREAIEGMLRIKDLWLPLSADREHEGEVQALHQEMYMMVKALGQKEA